MNLKEEYEKETNKVIYEYLDNTDLFYISDYVEWLEKRIKALTIPVVVRQSEQLFCEKVIHHTCKWFDQYNGCMGCLVKKYEAK